MLDEGMLAWFQSRFAILRKLLHRSVGFLTSFEVKWSTLTLHHRYWSASRTHNSRSESTDESSFARSAAVKNEITPKRHMCGLEGPRKHHELNDSSVDFSTKNQTISRSQMW